MSVLLSHSAERKPQSCGGSKISYVTWARFLLRTPTEKSRYLDRMTGSIKTMNQEFSINQTINSLRFE